jgi:hypothetical protein
MKSALLISIAALAVACDGSHQARTDTSATATRGGSRGATPPAPGSETRNGTVTLVGCLHGPGLPRATGTPQSAGDRASSAAAGIDTGEEKRHGAARIGPFVLSNAAVESGDAGPNGAGAVGGAVASAGLSFELDGLPADAQASVNKRIRVTGRLDLGATTSGATSGRAATTDASGAVTAVPGTTGATSTRDDVRANSTGVAGDSTNHRLTVETVEVLAQQCGPR